MEDIFLYNHIKQAIKQRKNFSKDTEEQNFAESYCRRQLMKKKLSPNTANSNAKNKMKSLMKNFTHVETYVDLNQLLYSINVIRTKEIAQKKIASLQQKHSVSRISRIHDIQKIPKPQLSAFFQDSPIPSVDPIEALRQRFRGSINDKIKRKYQSENVEMNEILKYLEDQSHFNNSLLKNNSTNYLSYLNEELQKIQKTDDMDGESCAQNWKIFQQLNRSIGQHPLEKEHRTEYFKSTNLNSKQKKQENQLLHKISTFLQIALQNEHKEKWATKQLKKFRSTHGSFRFKKDKDERSKFFLKGINIQNENKEKEIFQNIKENPNFSKKSTLRKNENLMRKIKSQQRNIFGKCQLPSMNQNGNSFKPKSSRNVSDVQKLAKNQNPNILKIWDENANFEQRKTAPVNHDTIEGDFTRTLTKQFNRKSRQQEEKKQRTEVFLTDVQPRKSFLLNKRKQVREYTFITPNKTAGPFKTFMVGSSCNSEAGNLVKQTVIKESFLQLEDEKKLTWQKLQQTEAQQKSFKASASNPSLKAQSSMKKSQPSKSNLLSQTFTFKKRGKKQQIINKLSCFIEQINNEQKMSKAENEYYDSAINHLHDLSKTTYKNYEPEALAGYEEISELKKFVNGINPSLRKNKIKKGMLR